VRGVKGGSCLDITAALEQALGGQIAEREMTAESYETAQDWLQDELTVKG
jgi:hypothetical protein